MGLDDLCMYVFVISSSAGIYKGYKSLTNDCIVILQYYNDKTHLDNSRVLNKCTKFTEALKIASNIKQLKYDRNSA